MVVSHLANGTPAEPGAIEVPVSGGAETIRVEVTTDGLLLTNGSRWRQSLTREEAWRLAEAVDELATRARDA